jgi:hypothetical protein
MQLLTSLEKRLFIAAQSSPLLSTSTSTSTSISTSPYNGCILIIHTNNNTIHELNFNTTSTTTTTTTTTASNVLGNNEHHTKQLKQQSHHEINYIYCSNDGRYVFASLVNKHLYCWEYNNDDDKYVFISSTILKKRPTSLVHTVVDGYGLDSKKDILFVSDKAGDVWSIDVPFLKKQVLVSGHCASVITDMAVHQLSNVQVLPNSNTENVTSLIATADRDEKIRITCFPHMVTIMSYCLGHTNVITSIAFFNINQKLFLISGGWDHSYIIWDPITGQALDKVSMIDETQIKSIEQQQSNLTAEKEEKVEDNDEEEDDENKQYNEEVAGNYPLKIRVTTSPSPLAAIIFRRLPTIKLYIIDDGKFGQSFDLSLPQVPVDVSFLQGQEEKKSSLYNDESKVYLGHLAVLLPQPECLQVFEIYKDNGNIHSIPSTPFSELLETFKNDCVKRNITFEQVTGFGDENAGMNRDALDRPFKKEVIDISNRKHNKRSKRKLEELDEKKVEEG